MKVTLSTRRQFIKAAATGITAFNLLPRHVLGGPGFVPPSEKVNVGVVGAGGRGIQNMKELFQFDDAQVIAIADPAEAFSLEEFYYKGAGGREPARFQAEEYYAAKTPNYRCAGYEDFRVMIEKEKALDAILCATPDHLHAYVSIFAMRSGKHVYCEKPLTHNIWEAREVLRVARETGVATQMGNQGHSTHGIRETVEHLRAGTIGPVREVHAWVDSKRWNPALTTMPAGASRLPTGLNWDLWLGPREARPFHTAYFSVRWRDFWAFGSSAVGDFGCHDLDAAMWAFDLPMPARVEARSAGPSDDEISPHGCTVFFEFPAQGPQHVPRITWYDGGLRPRSPEALGAFPLPKRGVLFVGERGVIQCDGAGGAPRVFPETLRASMVKPPPALKRSKGHHRDWIDACKGGESPSARFEYGARLTELVLLGVLAVRMKAPIEWDADTMSARGLPEADAIVRGSYRPTWRL